MEGRKHPEEASVHASLEASHGSQLREGEVAKPTPGAKKQGSENSAEASMQQLPKSFKAV